MSISHPSKPKRRWFQFHLSTAIVMMLVTGAWLGANFTIRGPYAICITTSGQGDSPATTEYEVAYFIGWPFPHYQAGEQFKTLTPAPWPAFGGGFSLIADLCIGLLANIVVIKQSKVLFGYFSRHKIVCSTDSVM